ncbi:MAG: hypothetical protein J6S71_10285 [Clostridia bacterium]|nr:hypothetical protein [Clostridia bacterium]
MKKIFSFVLAAIMLFSAVSCATGGGDPTSAPDTVKDPITDPATDPIPESNPAPETTEAIKEDEMLNILFLGNSLMYYNEMPELFAKTATAMGKKVNVKSVTKGSATISDFADESTEVGSKAIPLLKNNKWDYVIIEPSRRISPYENTVKEAELASAKKIRELAKAAGGDVLLYSVWGNNNGTVAEHKAITPTNMPEVATHLMGRKSHTKFMHEVNLEFAAALGGVKVALAGYAFENCIAKYPEFNLYHSDERHPSPIGSYLAAAVIYATVFGENVENIPYAISAAPAKGVLEGIANDTVLGGLVPDLTETEIDKPFNLLIVGSNLMDDYSCASVFTKLVKEADGRTVVSQYVRSSTFVINNLVDEKNDLGLRAALAETDWDAIVIQISRRCTKSATDVEDSELNALRAVMPLLKAETDNIFLFTLNSKSKPGIFTTASGAVGYTDSGKKETYSAADGTAYFKALADKWAAEFGIGVINYGAGYLELSDPQKTEIGYLQACMIYNAVFGKTLPDNLSETNGIAAAKAATLRDIAKKYGTK